MSTPYAFVLGGETTVDLENKTKGIGGRNQEAALSAASHFENLDEDMDFTIKPKQDEIVINKHTASIFIDTGFERMLRNAGIITIVFTGIATEFGRV